MSESAEEMSRAVAERQAHGNSLTVDSRTDTLRGLGSMAPMLAGSATLSQQELVDRLCEDQVRRWRAGQRIPAESYLARNPSLQESGEFALELIYGEFLMREELGESPQLEEFHLRFPRFASRLQNQVDLHGALLTLNSTPEKQLGAAKADGDPDGPQTSGATRFIAPGFRILGELGRGGMGSVYKVWQVRLKRVVAVKVIRADAYADSGAAARFQAEAEAAARLQHPNIVQVFEVGEHEGMAYLVLEYQAGGGLDRRLAGMLQDPHDSARLIETLARAIHYAHQNGIVHRDLKPANVLLTDDGIPKISDFGLAKLLEQDDRLTQVGDILGTPSYMAPEQVRGSSDGITPATDVYALGAILYEMLTGRPPFKGTTALSTMEQVSSIEPLAPAKLHRHTPRDLNIVCLKCLQKDPRRRYASALDLADDLRRFLDRQPILARQTPTWERAWKWARRRPSAATALLSVLMAIMLILGGALYHNARLRVAVRTAQSAEQASRNNAKAAFEQRNLALQAFQELVYGVQEKLAQTPATRAVRRDLLDKAIAGLEQISGSTAGLPPDLSRAVAHQKLGDMYRIIGRFADAKEHYAKSRTLSEELLALRPDNLATGDVLYQTRMGLGLVDMATERFAQAKIEFESAATIAEVIAAAEPGQDVGRRGLIEAYLQIGRADGFLRNFAAAEAWFRKMLNLAEAWVAKEPGNHHARDLLASGYRKLADIKKFSKHYADARHDYLSAISIGRELVNLEPLNFDFKFHLSVALDDLAGVERDVRNVERARWLFQEAERLFMELANSDPDHLHYRTNVIRTQIRRAAMEKNLGRFAQAAEIYRTALAHLRRLENEGRLEDGSVSFTDSKSLEKEIEFCEVARLQTD
jgi:eukaryotic-like serine/threonine-protein kinase